MPMFSKATYERARVRTMIAEKCSGLERQIWELQHRIKVLESQVSNLPKVVVSQQVGTVRDLYR